MGQLGNWIASSALRALVERSRRNTQLPHGFRWRRSFESELEKAPYRR